MHEKGYVSPEEKLDRATPYAKSEILFQRPIRPGDRITSVVELAEKYVRRESQFMTWRARAWDAGKRPGRRIHLHDHLAAGPARIQCGEGERSKTAESRRRVGRPPASNHQAGIPGGDRPLCGADPGPPEKRR